ncbi:MAG: ribosome biogenesis GTPase Der [Rhizobacter sp.]|nr:ribosome biogenesis GTPase Der [Chlorobiales bacterium]
MRLPIVAIIGRANVGKSTLFNRIVRKRHAITDDRPGVTRDRNYLESEWNGKSFLLMDTGGYTKPDDEMDEAVREQTLIAIDEADVIVFLTDLKSGITDLDSEVAGLLRKKISSKKIIAAVNKVDSEKARLEAELFRKLGLGEPHFISALSGGGVADMLDEVINGFEEIESDDEAEDADAGKIKLAIVGRPNVGKSSLVNALTGEKRHIVTTLAGTTRDSIDSVFKRNDEDYVLIDTAGLRKRARVEGNIELYSTLRTEKAIERADVAILLLDAELGLENQDMKIINLVAEKKRGLVIAVNKWDLLEKDSQTADELTKVLQSQLKSFGYIPTVFISALRKQRIFKAIDLAREVWENRRKRIDTSKLNDVMQAEIKKSPPWSKSGKEIKIKYVAQLSIEPPLICFYASNAGLVEPPYRKWLERKIREHFGFEGTPIELRFREKTEGKTSRAPKRKR